MDINTTKLMQLVEAFIAANAEKSESSRDRSLNRASSDAVSLLAKMKTTESEAPYSRVDDANMESAFLTNEDGYDVLVLDRVMPDKLTDAEPEHRAQCLNDAQWQSAINLVDAAPRMKATLEYAETVCNMAIANKTDYEGRPLVNHFADLAADISEVLEDIATGHVEKNVVPTAIKP